VAAPHRAAADVDRRGGHPGREQEGEQDLLGAVLGDDGGQGGEAGVAWPVRPQGEDGVRGEQRVEPAQPGGRVEALVRAVQDEVWCVVDVQQETVVGRRQRGSGLGAGDEGGKVARHQRSMVARRSRHLQTQIRE
jgi:hypothetical protein